MANPVAAHTFDFVRVYLSIPMPSCKIALDMYYAKGCPGDSANGMCLRYLLETPEGEVLLFDKRLELDALVAKNQWSLAHGEMKIPSGGSSKVKPLDIIFIGILSKSTTDSDLTAFFSANGAQVMNAQVARDAFEGSSRRFGTAQAVNPAAVVAACNGELLNGYSVTVREI